MMNTVSLPVPIAISPYVKSIIVMNNCNPQYDVVLPFIADGYPGVVFQTTDSGLVSSRNKNIYHLFLYGQNVKPVELYAKGNLLLIGYFLYPHVLKSFFGFHARELTDVCIDLSHFLPSRSLSLKEQLINAESLETRLILMDKFILKIVASNYSKVNNAVLFATEKIQKSNGMASLKNIQIELSISERSFQRLFEYHVGLSPKLYSRICQFSAAFQQLNKMQYSKLSDIAFDNGYTDQSHFTRTFKEFTNYSPNAYLKNDTDQQS